MVSFCFSPSSRTRSSCDDVRDNFAFTERLFRRFIKLELVLAVGDVGEVGMAAGGGSCTEESRR